MRGLVLPELIATDRLILRAPREEDASELNAAVHETWDELSQWMAWATKLPTLEESRAQCVSAAERVLRGEDFGLFGFDRESGRFALACGLHPRNREIGLFEIGYWRRACFGGQGLVAEAVRAVCKTCFETLEATGVALRCDSLNFASQAVAERCGFVLDREIEDNLRQADGRFRRTRLYSLARESADRYY